MLSFDFEEQYAALPESPFSMKNTTIFIAHYRYGIEYKNEVSNNAISMFCSCICMCKGLLLLYIERCRLAAAVMRGTLRPFTATLCDSTV